MNETIKGASKTLLILQVTVPPATVLTVPTQVKILELLGIVSNPELVRAMNISLALVAPNTIATVHGLFQLLSSLIKMNPKATKAHHDSLAKHLSDLGKVPNEVLTYGTFLPICETLIKAAHNKRDHKG
jgi:hypothetical protein